ncbi:MAG: methyltransferase domain-containing protein [Motiliproteus sp.]|nr:methyltransferase domain-containing protein [Motiliproteus sp.]MCW9052142.1 methyltransferase domain-containing protein [Motiliproteus sp.]
MFEYLQCPLCRQPLQLTDRTLRCENNHCFDQARQGYFHLLPVQNKRSRLPGDNAEMVRNRRSFLERGHYQPIAEAVTALVSTHLAKEGIKDNKNSILDCGCGEGYYTQHLAENLPDGCQLIGVDISKDAVKAACQRNRQMTWIVASGAHIPAADNSVDVLTCLFTPLALEEFQRVLKPGGLLLIASTGPNHLMQLRDLIYEEVKQNFFDPEPGLRAVFKNAHIYNQHLEFAFQLDSNPEIQQLLAMTPHQWRASAEARQRLEQQTELAVNADIYLHCVELSR